MEKYSRYVRLPLSGISMVLEDLDKGGSKPVDPFLLQKMKKGIFKNTGVFAPTYIPSRLIGRDQEILNIGNIIGPALDGEHPHNAFVYGKTGVGKSVVTKYVLLNLAEQLEGIENNVKSVFINCRQINTPIKIIKKICNIIAPNVEIPPTGLATSEYYARLWKILNDFNGITIIVLDEVDKVENDSILYNLTRAEENLDLITGCLSVLCISNDLGYKARLDVRTLSSFGIREVIFSPYDANQLGDILEDRAKEGFNEKALGDEVIPLCAAFAAQEHGDARRAIELLECAGELAVGRKSDKVQEEDVRGAEIKIETDRFMETIRTLPTQQKAVLSAIVSSDARELDTDRIYIDYREVVKRLDLDTLSKIRVSILISELDMLGLIDARVMSRGRYGRVRLVRPVISKEKTLRVLEEDYRFNLMAE